jgi:AraC-like DNA-binding protein
MHKVRQVRFQFPAAFVELVRSLASEFGKRDIANALALPLSTVYRWSTQSSSPPAGLAPGWARRGEGTAAQQIDALVASSEADGFDVRAAVARLVPALPVRSPGAAESPRRSGNREFLAQFADRGAADGPDASAQDRLLRARSEIDTHYYTRLSCQSLARIAGMSKFNFIRGFRAQFGISPYRYLNVVRVEHAKHMLALTDQPLQLVAASVGFASASSLARAFKRYAGNSPSRFLFRLAAARAERRRVASGRVSMGPRGIPAAP